MKVVLVQISPTEFCLIDPSNDWKEGPALDTRTNEIVYYNGDYGEERPAFIKRLIAEPKDIEAVQWIDDTSTKPYVIKKIKARYVIDDLIRTITTRNGVCIAEKQVNGKYTITL